MENEIARLSEAVEALRAELETVKAECERYKNDCQRYRNEARSAAANARTYAGASELCLQKKNWITESVPTPPDPVAYYDAGENAYLMYHDRSSMEEFEAYCKSLEDAGYRKHCTEVMGKGTHSFYHNEAVVISVTYSEHDNVLRAVIEPAADTKLAPLGLISDGKKTGVAPCFVQMNDHINDVVNCGMSYIYRLSDGAFVIIDGGWNTEPIADSLYEKLVSLAEGGEIIISAWFFTHAHVDHIGAFYTFARKHGDKVTLKRVIHNFPGESRMTEMGDEFVRGFVRNFRRTLALFGENIDVIKARTGQRFHFVGLDMDQLFTYEDYIMPRPLRTFNDTSLAFLARAAGEQIFFPGDASEKMSGILVAKYGELLKSDVIQVAHHGFGGGTLELYDTAKAPIVLWPCPYADPGDGPKRYSDPEWSPITREMIRNYATDVYPQCEGTKTWLLPISDKNELA